MLIFDLFQSIKDNDYKLYILSKILYFAAPTIFCDKPSTIINFENINEDFYSLLPSIKDELLKKYKLRTFELVQNKNKCIILFYKKNLLKKVLQNNMEFLVSFGYGYNMSLDDALSYLKQKYSISCPHEIGVFLGIPSEDVKAFICNNVDCKLCGYWKVYSNVEEAEKIFKKYDIAKSIAIEHILNEAKINMLN